MATSKPISHGVAEIFICDRENHESEDYNYPAIFKGAVHSVIVPLLLAMVFSPKIASTYFLGASVLYLIVFTDRAKYFFGSFVVGLFFYLVLII